MTKTEIPTTPEAEKFVLPQERSTPSLAIATARMWVYGEAGVGKTTLATSLHDEVLLLATDPGYQHLSVFAQPIGSWQDFRDAVSALRKTDKFGVIAIDTIEGLYKLCREDKQNELKIAHAGDLDYGKGWDAVNTSFQTGIAAICALGRGVCFVSHEKTEEGKGFNPVTKVSPNLSGGPTRWLSGFVDYVFRAVAQDGDDGLKYLLQTTPSAERVAKQRIIAGGEPLPEILDRPVGDPSGPLRAALASAVPSTVVKQA